MDFNKLFQNIFSKNLKKGIHTKNGRFFDEVEKGLNLGRSNLIFGDCEERLNPFIEKIYASFAKDSESSFTIIRKNLGDQLFEQLSGAGKKVLFIDLAKSDAKDEVAQSKNKGDIFSSHIIAVFPEETDDYVSCFDEIQENIEEVLNGFCQYIEDKVNAIAAEGKPVSVQDKPFGSKPFFFDRARFYTPHLKYSKRLPVLLAQSASILKWKGFWVIDSLSLNGFRPGPESKEIAGDMVIESVSANASSTFLIFERDKGVLEEIEDYVARISQLFFYGDFSAPALKDKKLKFRSDEEFLVGYAGSVSEKARRKDISTGRYRTVTIQKKSGLYAVLTF